MRFRQHRSPRPSEPREAQAASTHARRRYFHRALFAHQESPFLNRTSANRESKSRIERAAAKLISDGETRIVNGVRPTFAFAAYLRTHRHLTVVTDNVAMLSVLPPKALQDVYLLGGQYRLDDR
jgi:DeoR/GlpR family transcriptional regulator of sugar metabolism